MALASVQNKGDYTRNGCASVLIFCDPASPPSICLRGRGRARRIGGLCAPAADAAAAVRNQSRNRVGNPSRRPGSVQAHTPSARPAAQRGGQHCWEGVNHAHRPGTETRWDQSTL